MELKDKIKKLRRGQYSQEELASLLGVSYVTVSRWENGTMTPTMKYMPKLAEALNTTVSYLTGETDDPRSINSIDKTEPLQAEINFEPVDKDDTARRTSVDKGTLVYTFGDKKLEVPNTPETAPLFWARVDRLIGLQPTVPA